MTRWRAGGVEGERERKAGVETERVQAGAGERRHGRDRMGTAKVRAWARDGAGEGGQERVRARDGTG